MYTVKEIEAAVEQDWDGSWMEFLECSDSSEGSELASLGVVAREVEEGGEKYVWVVFQINDQLFRKSGFASSWEGTDWDGGLEEVESYEKTVVAFRKKK